MPPSAPHRIGLRLTSVVFGAAGLNALVQVPNDFPGLSDEPTILWAFQAVIGACGIAAAYGAWRYRRWSWIAGLAYAVITSGMILALGPILDLDADAREQLPLGAGLVLVVTGLLAWYLRRATTPSVER
jgi:hypothetical protein